MTTKQFFASSAFKSIVVLLCIVIICGTILAIANDIFYVSDQELFQRAITKVYGTEVQATPVAIADVSGIESYGEIKEAYLMADGNYLIKSMGINGFNGGTVTLWVKANFVDEKFDSIGKVVVDSYQKQTYMSKFSSGFYENYTKFSEAIKGGKLFSIKNQADTITNITTGATLSSNAHNNAVNCALIYISNAISKDNTPKLPHQNTVKDVVVSIDGDKVSYELTAKLNIAEDFVMKIQVENNILKLIEIVFDGTGSDYKDKDFSQETINTFIGKDFDYLDNLDDSIINTGATLSNNSILNALKFATKNYEYFKNGGILS